MDIKTARSLEAKAVQRIAEKHEGIEARLAALEAAAARIEAALADLAAARPGTTNSKKGG